MYYKYSSQEQLMTIIDCAEANVLISLILSEKNLNPKNDKDSLLLIIKINSFEKALSIIHTLLCSTTKNDLKFKEIILEILDKIENIKTDKNNLEEVGKLYKHYKSVYPDEPDLLNEYNFLKKPDNLLIGDYVQKLKKILCKQEYFLDSIKKLKKKFENNKFHIHRHHFVGHKNNDSKKIFSILCWGDLNISKINNLRNIISEMKLISCIALNRSFGNQFCNFQKSLRDLMNT